MAKLMLIDAAHAEETRLVVVNNGIIEEFEYQNTYKKSIKANIYLAKVIRVEPSLQAAFVDYGHEKHGFLPFAEIHPSYYQIPEADKEALLRSMMGVEEDKVAVFDENQQIEQFEIDDNESEDEVVAPTEPVASAEPTHFEEEQEEAPKEPEEGVVQPFRPEIYKQYKIQDVVKKDQVLLIQAVKEERGNKGASMTTFISLAGRFCVLMPNSFKAGGVSRKIFDVQERHRLKGVAEEMNEKAGRIASVIVRTAGAYKTKVEIKRDFNYLIRLWNNIRDHTLASKAPAFIHEEGDVIKKSIRDVYSSDTEQVLISGNEACDIATKFMEMIMPRHVSKVKKYKGKASLFTKYNIENQLSALYDPIVPLRSGGYLVINHTEALVAIDVNSGRSTSERNVENTATRTNIEAAKEIARQMRLRDLSGLIVIDFIDMEDLRNRKSVERAFRDALFNDRAKIQMGRIGMFGLLEMTRQRLRQSFFESNTNTCPNCEGRGRVRPIEATAVAVLRALDNEIAGGKTDEIKVSGSEKLMFYILNNKREEVSQLEKTSKTKITFYTDEEAGADGFFVEKMRKAKEEGTPSSALSAIDFAPYSIAEKEEGEEQEEEKILLPEQKDQNLPREEKPYRRRWKKPNQERTFKPQEQVKSEVRSEPRNEPRLEVRNESRNEPRNEVRNESRNEPRRDDKPVRKWGKKEDGRGGGYRAGYKPREKEQEIAPPKQNEVYDFEEESKFEETMEKKRKQNQSLLKEIWKKIVQ